MNRVRLPLDDKKDDAIRIVREELGRGADWDSIASRLSKELGIKVTPDMVRYFWFKHVGYYAFSNSERPMKDDVEAHVSDFDKELDWLYSIVKRRIETYRKLEEMAELPVPDTDRAIKVAVDIIKLKMEYGSKRGTHEMYVDILKRIFGGSNDAESEN